MQSTCILSRAAELPGQSVYMHGNIFIPPTHAKISHLVTKFVNKSSWQVAVFALLVTSCQHGLEQAVNNLLQHCWYYQACYKVVATSPIQSSCVVNRLSIYMTVSDLFENNQCDKSEYEQGCYKLLAACSKLVPTSDLLATTGNKWCKDNLLSACEQICNNLFADL